MRLYVFTAIFIAFSFSSAFAQEVVASKDKQMPIGTWNKIAAKHKQFVQSKTEALPDVSSVVSLKTALETLRSIDRVINEIRIEYRTALADQVLAAAIENSSGNTLIKGEFETNQEFQQRRLKAKRNVTTVLTPRQVHEVFDKEYRSQILPLLRLGNSISRKRFRFEGTSELRFQLGTYDIEREEFPFTIASPAVKLPPSPCMRVTRVTTNKRSARDSREYGLIAGDVILAFAGSDLHPEDNFAQLLSNANSKQVSLEIERDGVRSKLLIPSGFKPSVYIKLDNHDYYETLPNNSFVMSGKLRVPRLAARQLKEAKSEGKVHVAVEVQPLSPELSIVRAAKVTNRINGNSYNPLDTDFLAIGHGIVFEPRHKLLWWEQDRQRINEREIQDLNDGDFDTVEWLSARCRPASVDGWKIPSVQQFSRIEDYLGHLFGGKYRPNDSSGDSNVYFWTSEFRRDKGILYQAEYRPSDKRTEYTRRHNNRRFPPLLHVLQDGGFASEERGDYLQNDKYALFDERFVPLRSNQLQYDGRLGLIWQTSHVGSGNDAQAKDIADKCRVAEISRWRLPSVDEAGSLYNPVEGRSFVPFAGIKGYIRTSTVTTYRGTPEPGNMRLVVPSSGDVTGDVNADGKWGSHSQKILLVR